MDDHQQQLATLRLFNEKVDRLADTRLAKKLKEKPPEVRARVVKSMALEKLEGGHHVLTAWISSELTDFDQDEIDAFVLTYRMFTQKNDRVSLPSLAAIYESEWMPSEAMASFRHAQTEVQKYLDSDTTLQMGQVWLTRRHLTDTIIYGALAHSNVVKEREFLSWTADGGATGFVWAEFLATMKDMLEYLQFFKSLNHAVIQNHAA